jgi:hypothetical protein
MGLAGAAPVVLSDGNSSLTVDPSAASGISGWTVEGQNQISQQTFFYRVGDTGPILSIDTLGAPTVNTVGGTKLETTYTTADFIIRVDYLLQGGTAGSGNSSLGIAMSIENLGLQPLSFEFYEYGAYTPGGSVNNTVQLGTSGSGLFNEALVTGGGVTVETAVTAGAQQGEAALYSSTLSQFAAGTSLSGSTSAGPGFVTWAFGWERIIAGEGTVTFSSVHLIDGVPTNVPETAGISILLIGFAGCGLFGLFVTRTERRLALARVRC